MPYYVSGGLREDERALVRQQATEALERVRAREAAEQELEAKIAGALRETVTRMSDEERLFLVGRPSLVQRVIEQLRAEASAVDERKRQLRELPGRIEQARRDAQAARDDMPRLVAAHGEGYRSWSESIAAQLDMSVLGMEQELAQLKAIEEAS